jgi:CRISPR-associated protein Csd2
MSFLKNPGPTNVEHRMDGLFMFTAANSNPNGDPDNDGRPRQDQETGHGEVTNVCIKRHLRDTAVQLYEGKPGMDIYIQSKAILDHKLSEVHASLGFAPKKAALKSGKKKDKEVEAAGEEGGGMELAVVGAPEEKSLIQAGKDERGMAMKAAARMCELHFDVRTFGAVMSSKVANSGQVRGPIQISYARSVDPVVIADDSITRMAIQTDREAEANFMNQTFGSKSRVLFGLYVGQVYFNPGFARKTGFKESDLEMLWECFGRLFEYSRASGRDGVAMKQIIVFEHDNPLGCAHSQRLIDLVTGPGPDGKPYLRRVDEGKPARQYSDYKVPTQEEVQQRIEASNIRGVKTHFLL